MGRRSIFVLLCVLCARLSATFQLSAAMLHPCKVALVTGANKGIGKEVSLSSFFNKLSFSLSCTPRQPHLQRNLLGEQRHLPNVIY